MNLKKYYQRVQEIEQGLPEGYVHLTSLATPNGGKDGLVTEVDRELAARMIADGVARESSEQEVAAHREEVARALAQVKETELRNRLRITLLNEPDLVQEKTEGEAPAKGRK